MPVAFAPGAPGGVDPFSGRLERRGRLTHGHLRENNNHGGRREWALRRAAGARRPCGDRTARDHGLPLRPGRPAARRRRVPPGRRRRRAAARSSATPTRRARSTTPSPPARAPCNRTAGIAYPLAERAGRVRLGRAGVRPGRPHARGQPRHLVDAPRTWVPARTTTSAASTRSCAGRSGSKAESGPPRRGRFFPWPTPSLAPACGSSRSVAPERGRVLSVYLNLDPSEFATPSARAQRDHLRAQRRASTRSTGLDGGLDP